MKITCSQSALSKALDLVEKAVPAKPTIQILSNVLLETRANRVRLAATNLEMTVIVDFEAKTDIPDGTLIETTPEMATIPAKKFADFVGSLPSERIDMVIDDKHAQIKCARSEARLSVANAKDYPVLPKINDQTSIKIDSETLRDAIKRVAVATSDKETRPELTGVYMNLDNKILTLAGVDRFCIAIYRIPVVSELKATAIIPGKSAGELEKLHQGEVIICFEPTQVAFKTPGINLMTQVIVAKYPDFERLVPEKHNCRVVVNTSEFLSAVKRADVFSRDAGGFVKIVLAGDRLTLSTKEDQGGDNVTDIDAAIEGTEISFGIATRMVLDVLGVIKEQQVSIELIDARQPVVIRPVGNDNYIYIAALVEIGK